MSTTTPTPIAGPDPLPPLPPLPPSRPRGREGLLRGVAVAAGLVAMTAAMLLPFAPVLMSTPEIRWPADPADPAPTMLMLTAYEPETLTVDVSCRAVRAGAEVPGGLVLATMAPESRDLATRGLEMRSAEGRLTVRSSGDELFDGPVPPGDCTFRVAGDAAAMTVALDGRVLTVTPTRVPESDDELPESEPEATPQTPLPEVDALVTGLGPSPDATAGDLSVRMVLDDAFDTTPGPVKTALIWTAGIALAIGAVAAVLLARSSASAARPAGPDPSTRPLRGPPSGTADPRPWWRRLRPRAVDLIVPAVLIAWTVLAPMTDDDGYYSAMAANVPFGGYVPNYYQLYHQGFTPFSWIYYALSWWQSAMGTAPVVLRIPSTVLGILTWFLIRSFVARARVFPHDARWAPIALRVVLAAAFLAWWLPYDASVRPEPMVAVLLAATLVAVVEGLERARLDVLGLAAGTAALGVAVAPTGFACLAPLLAAAPAVWRMVRARAASWAGVAGRWVIVLAPGSTGLLAGFADGSWRDFVRSQEIFAPIQRARTWYEEFDRYAQLMETTTHFGAYSRRTAVVVCLLALVAFGLIAVAARMRELPVPSRLLTAGWATVLAFALLLPTPSNPTHHFGAFAGLGAAFLALILVRGPGVVRDLDLGRRPPRAALTAAAVATALVLALSWHGRNLWPFAWGLGMPTFGNYPTLAGIRLDGPVSWMALLAVATAAVTGFTRWHEGSGDARHDRRAVVAAGSWRGLAAAVAIPGVIVLSLVVGVVKPLQVTADAALRTAGTWSPQADAWVDPEALRCGAAQRVDVLDPAGTRRLPDADRDPPREPMIDPAVSDLPGPAAPPGPSGSAGSSGPSAPPLARTAPDLMAPSLEGNAPPGPADRFRPGAWLPGRPPPALPPGTAVRGSLVVPGPGADADSARGTSTSGWFALPPDGDEEAAVVAVAGRLGDGVSLHAEYAQDTAEGPRTLASTTVGGTRDSADWDWVPLIGPDGPPPDADRVRLVGVDDSTSTGGWLGFSDPLVRPWVPLPEFLPPDAPIVVDWTQKFQFPCLRQPVQRHGVTEPAVAVIGDGPDARAGLSGWTFDPDRGGLAGHAVREATVTPLAVRFRGGPGPADEVDTVQVYDLRQPFGVGGYEHHLERRSVSGVG